MLTSVSLGANEVFSFVGFGSFLEYFLNQPIMGVKINKLGMVHFGVVRLGFRKRVRKRSCSG